MGMPDSPTKKSWVVPALIGAVVAMGLCSIAGIAGWYLFIRPGVATETPQPVAQFILPTGTPTLALATLLPTVTATPSVAMTSAAVSPPAGAPAPAIVPTRPRPTNTPGTLTGKIAFSVDRGERPEDKSVWIMNVDGSGAKKILDRASSPVFSPDGGRIAYYHWNDGIFIANVDGTNPRQIVFQRDAKYLAWSHDGKWIAFSSKLVASGNVTIDAVMPDALSAEASNRRTIAVGDMPAWSYDDKTIALSACKGSACGVHRVGSEGGDPIPVTTDAGGSPAWSPDGRKILYVVESNQVKQLFTVNADGADKKQLTQGPSKHLGGQWSVDGNYIFYRAPDSGKWAIWRMNADGTNSIKLIDDAPPVDEAFEKLAIITSTK
jgi:TolB protein